MRDSKSRILERRPYSENQIIFHEGEDAFNAYIIQAGRVRIFSERGGKKVELGILHPGDIFGEMALISDGVRTASAEAMNECSLVVVRREMFADKLKNSDVTIQAVVKMLSERMLHSNAEMVKAKGVNIDNFIALLNQIFRDLLEAMPDEDKSSFREDAFPILKQMIDVIEKYRDKL